MTWLFTLLSMTVIALVVGVVTGSITGSMGVPESSLPFRGLPEEEVTPAGVEQVRFDAALRGYRMEQVDQVLDRLADELRRRDDLIEVLLARVSEHDDPADRSDDSLGGDYGDFMIERGHPGDDRPQDGGGPSGGGCGGLMDGLADGTEAGPGYSMQMRSPYGSVHTPPSGRIDLDGWPGRS